MLALLVAGEMLAGCTTYVGHFQDPSTRPAGDVSYGVGGTALLPLNVVVWGHVGLTDWLELQVQAELPAGLGVGLKWGVLGNATTGGPLVAVCATAGGYFGYTQDAFGGGEVSATSIGGGSERDTHRPTAGLVPVDATLQLGYRFGSDLVLYIAPRYSYRAYATAAVERHGWGVTVGASAGPKRERLFVEIGIHENPFPPAYSPEVYESLFMTLALGVEWN